MARRSLLFAPGDKPDLMRKTPDSDPDTVVFDLEDAVAPGEKAAGREAVNGVLSDPAFDPNCEVCVRVNPDPAVADDDLKGALAGDATVDSVMLPKTESADDVATLAALLDERDVDVPVIALCESAAGVLRAEAIAASDPVEAVAFGAEDLSADVGATRTAEGTEVLYAREHVVLAAAAADVAAIDTVFTDIENTDGLREDTAFALELGYDGKMCIHPAQVGVVNDAFTPDEERIAWARRVLDAAAEAERESTGVFRVDGEMVDAPLVAQAEQVRERARAAGVWERGS
ncbi:HpcH/HpaI aldolase/citrate lyase family protein [Halorarius halobius]|uniref:HpcH/HpaI aldolase/citrate lyase family protein n=1 Tax=Halorarius halobius TaxID=2962671 RepID=UPI0020CEDEE4|nr:CoA ester lyase [Halorarius halobius]